MSVFPKTAWQKTSREPNGLFAPSHSRVIGPLGTAVHQLAWSEGNASGDDAPLRNRFLEREK